ncbi:uncharacterized protein CDAR_523941 [Caerostris darwini]|uniref:Uncharacterized protein n=1 Tax=Caerostris darwini TaxID=1538125 RepID=A0AAV4TXZ8_9ARAC|nr:uncharacterized protein CDAR_523941 [Caerostris darwini]
MDLKKCAKFVYLGETDNSEDFNEEREALDVSCKGEWKLYPGENNDLILYYLESDHFLLTKKNVILESFSLPCSKSYLKGVAKADTLLMSCTLQEGKKRQFRVQFAEQDGEDGTAKRKECTNMLKKFIHVVDYSSEGEGSEPKKITDVSDVSTALCSLMSFRMICNQTSSQLIGASASTNV